MKDQVDILLATFQGELYLEELLQSLFTQTHHSIHVIARDDGSSDNTPHILKKWSETFPNNMTLLPTHSNLGIKGNFSELLAHSQAPYVMFADQDDKWLPYKVEDTLNLLQSLERQFDTHTPILVHTDLKVVDQNLKELSPSYWKYTGLYPEKTDLNDLLPQNVVTGCTIMMNQTLAKLSYPIPDQSMMHDWWVALVASCFGHIQFLNEATILYRQHSQNDTGAQAYNFTTFTKRLFQTTNKKKRSKCNTCLQAKCLLERYDYLFQEERKKQAIARAYAGLDHLSFIKQRISICKYHFFKHGFFRNLNFLLSRIQ